MIEKSPASPGARRSPIKVLPQYWQDEPGRRRYVDRLFDDTAGEYDFVERLLGFGRGPGYRRDALLRAGLAPGMKVLDVATGTGLVAREALSIVGSAGSVTGLDPSAGMLEQARSLEFPVVRGFGERLPFRDASFDFVSMGYALRHVADLSGLFGEMRRVLRPGGTACVLELTRPRNRTAASSLRVYMTRIVPLLARVAGRPGAGELMRFYWDTIDACVQPHAVLAAMKAAGLERPQRVTAMRMFSDYTARKS